jgi:hypothetical protein
VKNVEKSVIKIGEGGKKAHEDAPTALCDR